MKRSVWVVQDINEPADALKITAPDAKSAISADPSKKPRKRSGKKPKTSTTKNEEIIESMGLSDDWDWKAIPFPKDIPFTDDAAGGFLELQEIDNVHVEYKEMENGRKVVHFSKQVAGNGKADARKELAENLAPKNPVKKQFNDKKKNVQDIEEEDSMDEEDRAAEEAMREFDQQMQKAMSPSETAENDPATCESDTTVNNNEKIDMSAWEEFNLDESLVEALARRGFTQPTPIQKRVLPEAIVNKCHIIGAAETGSGKTLAFGLPIIHDLLVSSDVVPGLKALILLPTRELAVQVRDHLAALTEKSNFQIMTIIGGMSIEKQTRLLARKPDVIVATPGRFWEVLSENHHDSYLDNMHASLKFLVLDEADRMLENGHFKELDNILKRIQQQALPDEWADGNSKDAKAEKSSKDVNKVSASRQIFIFSATFSGINMSHILAKNKKRDDTDKSSLANLMRKLDFQGREPSVIDLTTEQLLAHGLTERKIDCVQKDKDLFLYYFFMKHPGRTIVFVNSIDSIRRLLPLFTTLNLNVWGLHAQMQQRQRLKNLERFRSCDKGILITSDVAARGLDIPAVDHVIHYQIPRTPELYVHRSGRTARAHNTGLTVLFNSAEEHQNYRMLCKLLKKPNGIDNFTVDLLLLDPLKRRIRLASDIEKAQHQQRKSSSKDRWLEEKAKAMDIDLDEDFFGEKETNDSDKKLKNQLKAAKVELDKLLQKPLLSRGVSATYLTKPAPLSLLRS